MTTLLLRALLAALDPLHAAHCAATLRAYRGLRRLIDRDAPALYAATPVDDAAEARWIIAAREAVADGSAEERAAVLLWAAVAAWTDAPQGAWGALADAGSALAETLACGDRMCRVADRLRGVMATGWEMEAGR